MRGKINFSEAESVPAANKKTIIKVYSVFINCLKQKLGRKQFFYNLICRQLFYMNYIYSVYSFFIIIELK